MPPALGRSAPLLVLALASVGCVIDRSPLAGPAADGGPGSGDAPTTDDAVVSTDAPVSTDAACAEGATRCEGALRERCEGGAWREAPCTLRCVTAGEGARCEGLVPSNVGGAPLTDGAGVAATLSGDLSTTDCPGGEVQTQAPGEPELCVLRFDGALALGPLAVVGARPLVLLVAGAVDVVGEVRLVGGLVEPGPGGGYGAKDDTPASGWGPGGDGVDGSGLEDGGGGGGGSCGPGGQGGDSASSGLRGRAGVAYPDGYLLEPLRGGSGGGRGATRGGGGGGGGALQISALGLLTLDASIFVGGGGGGGGEGGGNAAAGGGGGGGGGVLLESAIEVRPGAGFVLASGGGGGGGGSLTTTGGDGRPGDVEGSAGGGSAGTYGGTGGAGGSGPSGPAQDGETIGYVSNGGGGGGGAGCVVVRAPEAIAPPGTGYFRSAAPRLE